MMTRTDLIALLASRLAEAVPDPDEPEDVIVTQVLADLRELPVEVRMKTMGMREVEGYGEAQTRWPLWVEE